MLAFLPTRTSEPSSADESIAVGANVTFTLHDAASAIVDEVVQIGAVVAADHENDPLLVGFAVIDVTVNRDPLMLESGIVEVALPPAWIDPKLSGLCRKIT